MKKLFYVVILCALCSCIKEEEPRHLVINRELEKKTKTYTKKRLKRCQSDMMEEITLEVDSIMYFLVAKMNGETDIMPERPQRPKRLVDTITLESLQSNN